MNQLRQPFFIINLDRRRDRYDKLLDRMRDSNLIESNFQRFSATDGKEIIMTPEYCYLLRKNTYNKRRSVFATAMSHIRLYKNLLVDNENDYYVIFEDDIDFCPQYERKWKETIKKLSSPPRQNFDICFIGYMVSPSLENNNKYKSPTKPIELGLMMKNHYYSGLFGYVISKKGAKYMLDVIEKLGITHPIDTMMLFAMQQRYGKPFKALCTVPRLVYTKVAHQANKVDSDIQRDFEEIRYSLTIMTNDRIIFKEYTELVKEIDIKEESDNDEDQKTSKIIITSIDSSKDIPYQLEEISYPLIYIVKESNLSQLNEKTVSILPKDCHFLCETEKIMTHLDFYSRKSLLKPKATSVLKNIENYYFNYWKSNYNTK